MAIAVEFAVCEMKLIFLKNLSLKKFSQNTGAIIKLKDETEDGLDLNVIRRKVNKEIDDVDNNYEKMTYIGRTSDGNIQVVFVAKNPAETKYIISFADIIEKKLMGSRLFIIFLFCMYLLVKF